MGRRFLLGMDGGGSHARARLADLEGHQLGTGVGGPANAANDLKGTIDALDTAARAALFAAGLSDIDRVDVAAVIGAAGVSDPTVATQLAAAPFGFKSLRVVTDAEIALEGAFAGGDGGILIVGTGSQAYGRVGERRLRIGGWGPSLSDGGSGALIGRRAARRVLEAHEGLAASSPMTDAIFGRLGGSAAALSAFGKTARPGDWAVLAPIVFDHAAIGDPVAGAIIATATAEIEALLDRLVGEGLSKVALMGGLAASYRPRLVTHFERLIVDPIGDALKGALSLAGKDAAL